MAKYEGQDHYLDPETGVLKNKLGISEEEELKAAEASFIRDNLRELPVSDSDEMARPK